MLIDCDHATKWKDLDRKIQSRRVVSANLTRVCKSDIIDALTGDAALCIRPFARRLERWEKFDPPSI